MTELSKAKKHLEAWEAADIAASQGQSYSIAGRSLSRANAKEITEKIEYWKNRVQQLQISSSGCSSHYAAAEW